MPSTDFLSRRWHCTDKRRSDLSCPSRKTLAAMQSCAGRYTWKGHNLYTVSRQRREKRVCDWSCIRDTQGGTPSWVRDGASSARRIPLHAKAWIVRIFFGLRPACLFWSVRGESAAGVSASGQNSTYAAFAEWFNSPAIRVRRYARAASPPRIRGTSSRIVKKRLTVRIFTHLLWTYYTMPSHSSAIRRRLALVLPLGTRTQSKNGGCLKNPGKISAKPILS